jgi:type VI secretion system ImpM family protein
MPAGTCEPDAASPLSGVGFCGKLQSHGDFVRRRVPSTLLRRWEEWADAAMAAIRRHLGDNWPGSYLNSPIWRFAVSANCCGERPFLGIMMPSVDKVGRYHPLTILAALEPTACAASILPYRLRGMPTWRRSLSPRSKTSSASMNLTRGWRMLLSRPVLRSLRLEPIEARRFQGHATEPCPGSSPGFWMRSRSRTLSGGRSAATANPISTAVMPVCRRRRISAI